MGFYISVFLDLPGRPSSDGGKSWSSKVDVLSQGPFSVRQRVEKFTTLVGETIVSFSFYVNPVHTTESEH